MHLAQSHQFRLADFSLLITPFHSGPLLVYAYPGYQKSLSQVGTQEHLLEEPEKVKYLVIGVVTVALQKSRNPFAGASGESTINTFQWMQV